MLRNKGMKATVPGFGGIMTAILLGSAIAGAAELDPERYFTVQSIETQLLDEETGDVLDSHLSFMPAVPVGVDLPKAGVGDLARLSEIVNLGKQVWDIVVANEPVVDVAWNRATAIPAGVKDWRRMHGWKTPQARLYRIGLKNAYGTRVVDFRFRVLYTAGGSLDGKGRYLTHMTILPADLSVAWGYTFRSRGSIPSITNAGTLLNPLAAAELQLTWSVETVLKHQQGSVSFYVRGDGYFQQL